MAVLHRHSLLVITGLLYVAALRVKTTGAVSLVLLFPLPSPWNPYCRHLSSTMVHPAFDQELNSIPGEMHKPSPPVSAESLPAPSPASLPKAPLLLSLRCAKHLAVI